MRGISILGLHFSESSEMKRHGCFFLGIMQYNIFKISFDAFVQTIYHKEGIVFFVGLEGFWEIGRGVLRVSLSQIVETDS